MLYEYYIYFTSFLYNIRRLKVSSLLLSITITIHLNITLNTKEHNRRESETIYLCLRLPQFGKLDECNKFDSWRTEQI